MADSYSSGSGGDDWELVSLTASTYAAAPGPVLPLDAHEETDPSPPPPGAPAIFMSQHFNSPDAEEEHASTLNESHQQEESALATPELDDLSVCLAGEERRTVLLPAPAGFQKTTQAEAAGSDTRSTQVSCAAAASTDGIITVDSASLTTAHVAAVTGAARDKKGPSSSSKSRIPCEAHAWWNKTFSFMRRNSRESLTFRFIFVAATVVGLAVLGQRDKLQLRLEFNVDTEKINCAVSEPLGQVKLNMLVGGSPVAHGTRGRFVCR